MNKWKFKRNLFYTRSSSVRLALSVNEQTGKALLTEILVGFGYQLICSHRFFKSEAEVEAFIENAVNKAGAKSKVRSLDAVVNAMSHK